MKKKNSFVRLSIQPLCSLLLAFFLYHYCDAFGHVWEAILMPLSGVLGAAGVVWSVQLVVAALFSKQQAINEIGEDHNNGKA